MSTFSILGWTLRKSALFLIRDGDMPADWSENSWRQLLQLQHEHCWRNSDMWLCDILRHCL